MRDEIQHMKKYRGGLLRCPQSDCHDGGALCVPLIQLDPHFIHRKPASLLACLAQLLFRKSNVAMTPIQLPWKGMQKISI